MAPTLVHAAVLLLLGGLVVRELPIRTQRTREFLKLSKLSSMLK